MHNIDTKTFCAAPWFSLRTNTDGSFAPCCQFSPGLSKFQGKKNFTVDNDSIEEWRNSDYMKQVRQQLKNGKKIEECKKCWEKEKNNIISLRQEINDSVTDNQGNELQNTWINSFFKNPDRKIPLLTADVKISNLCNHSCVMCNPYDSSIIFKKWYREKENMFVKEEIKKNQNYFNDIKSVNKKKYSYDMLFEVLKYPIKHLKFLGGEPLLEKKLLKILSQISDEKKKNISLHFITNGSVDIHEVVKRYHLDYRSISISISLEGVGDVQEWARKGSSWQTVEKNIILAKNNNIQVSIAHTVQMGTILRLDALLRWCQENQLPITFTYLDNPHYLSADNLSTVLKETIMEKISMNKIIFTKAVNSHYSDGEITSENLVQFLKEKFKNNNEDKGKDKISKFYKFIEWYEKDSQLKLKNIVPELYYK